MEPQSAKDKKFSQRYKNVLQSNDKAQSSTSNEYNFDNQNMHYSELNFPKDVSTSSESSDEFTPAKVVVKNVVQNRMQLPNLVRGVERFQILNRAGAFLPTAFCLILT